MKKSIPLRILLVGALLGSGPLCARSNEDQALARVRTYVHQLEVKQYPSTQLSQIDVRLVENQVPLDGLFMVSAYNLMLKDALGHKCFTMRDEVTCQLGTATLENIVARYQLLTKPTLLDDKQWVSLVSFALGTSSLYPSTSFFAPSWTPRRIKRKFTPPRVTRSADGIEVSYVTTTQVLQIGITGFVKVTVRIEPSGKVSATRQVLYQHHD